MSEFYFDYRCIAMGGGNESDKALDFYLFQDYDSNDGAMCVQVYVPKAMQKKFCGARIFSSPNGVDLPDISDPQKGEWVACGAVSGVEADAANIGTDNCIYIRGKDGELSGSGVIAFIDGKDKNAVPKAENTYKYVINYSKKETISYYIKECGNGIKVKVIYPLIRNDISLGVIKKKGSKPVLIGDRDESAERLDASIVLKANGRRVDATKWIWIKAEKTSEYDFRLVFDDPSNNKYYLLVDESDDTIEDRKQRKEEHKHKHKLEDDVRKCPYCGRAIIPAKTEKDCYVYDCQGNPRHFPSLDPSLKKKPTVICAAKLSELSKADEKAREGAIPADNLILPPDYTRMPAMNIVVAGFPKAGKTVFLSSLINMREGEGARSYEANPFILNRILNKFDLSSKKEKNAKEVKFLNINDDGSIGSECEAVRDEKMHGEGIKERCVITAGAQIGAFTDPREAIRLSWNPIGFRMGELGHIYFYDIPGEWFTKKPIQKLRSADMADCFLAVIDGAQGAKKALGQLYDALKVLPDCAQHHIGLENMPIAIVFTKHDLRLSEYVSDPTTLRSCFDENCHVVRENMLDLIPANGVYAGSELERHIDCSSYEIEHFLKSVGSGAEKGSAELKKLKDTYKNVKFFTCSALGSDACLGEAKADDTKEVLFRPRRLRLELPLVWLMYQKGLIRR